MRSVPRQHDWRSRSPRGFFGLNSEYIEGVYEEMYFLMKMRNMSFTESYNLPIKIRRWFVDRIIKDIEDEIEASKKS